MKESLKNKSIHREKRYKVEVKGVIPHSLLPASGR